MNKKQLILGFVLLLLTATLQAQRGNGRGNRGGGRQGGQNISPDKIIEKLDTDKDAKISKEEASQDQRLSEHFDKLDVNGDGYITEDEFPKGRKGKRKGEKRVNPNKLFEEIDDDRDGLLNEFEIAAKENLFLKENFKAIDINSDGLIDKEELHTFIKSKKQKKN